LKNSRKLKLYLIGSLRNPEIPKIAGRIRKLGFDVFDDWYAAGPEADDKWRDYEKEREHSYKEALDGYAADHVFQFDKKHLLESNIAVLKLPAGRSGHLEGGVIAGFTLAVLHLFKKYAKRLKGVNMRREIKKFYIWHDNPDRWDVMYKFADGVVYSFEELETELEKIKNQNK